MATFTCPACQTRLELPEPEAGLETPCPGCGQLMRPLPSLEISGVSAQSAQSAAPAALPANAEGPEESETQEDDEQQEEEDSDAPARPPMYSLGPSQACVGLLIACAVLDALGLLIHVLQQVIVGQDLRLLRFDYLGLVVQVHALLHLLAVGATAVAFLLWLYMAISNLYVLNAADLNYSPGWAVGSFFVPILNLFQPYGIVQEIWKASNPANAEDAYAWTKDEGSNPALLWWICWVAGIGAVFVAGLLRSRPFPEDLLQGLKVQVFADLCFIGAALFLIPVVLGITARQKEKYARLYPEEDEREMRMENGE